MKCCLLFLIFPFNLIAQNYFLPSASNSWGLANTLVSNSYPEAVFDNPASLGFLNENSLFICYSSGYSIPALSIKSIGGNINLKNFHFGFGGVTYGDKLFSESQLSLATAVSNDKYSLGLKFAYQGINIDQLYSKSTFLFDFGGIAKLFPKAHFGFNFSNLFGANYYKNQPLPFITKIGVTFFPSSKVKISIQSDIITKYKPIFKVGLSYKINKFFEGRIGLSSLINRYNFGLGITNKAFQLDLAVSSDVNIGLREHITLLYKFEKRKL